MRVHTHEVTSCSFPLPANVFVVVQGQKDYGRCLRLSSCCVASSSSSPDSVKGAALRSNSRYTSSQSRRATANRQVGFSRPQTLSLLPSPQPVVTPCFFFPSFLPESHQEDVERHGATTDRVVFYCCRRQQHADP